MLYYFLGEFLKKEWEKLRIKYRGHFVQGKKTDADDLLSFSNHFIKKKSSSTAVTSKSLIGTRIGALAVPEAGSATDELINSNAPTTGYEISLPPVEEPTLQYEFSEQNTDSGMDLDTDDGNRIKVPETIFKKDFFTECLEQTFINEINERGLEALIYLTTKINNFKVNKQRSKENN